MLNILITGASGFIGRNFIEACKDYKIYTVSLKHTSIQDICFENIDVVLHLAALVHQMDGAPEEEYFKINHELSLRIAERAKQNKVKHFIFMSSAKVYGESSENGKPFDENSTCNPEDAYGKSKLRAEVDLIKLHDVGFTVSLIRIPLVYGTGVKGNMANLIRLIHALPVLPLGGINNKRSMLYIGNLVGFLKRVIDVKPPGVLISSDTKTISTTEIIRLISKAERKKIILITFPNFVYKIIGLVKPKIIHRLFSSFELNNGLSCKKLNFVNPYTTEQGIFEMVKNIHDK